MLEDTDKRSFSQLSSIFGFVLVLMAFSGVVYYMNKGSTDNAAGVYAALVSLLFMFALQTTAVTMSTNYVKDQEKLKRVNIRIVQLELALQTIESNIANVNAACYNINENFPRNQEADKGEFKTPAEIETDPVTNCTTSGATATISNEDLCNSIPGCNAGILDLPNPDGKLICENLCNSNTLVDLVVKKEEVERALATEKRTKQALETSQKSLPGIMIASNVVTLLVMMVLVVAFLMMARGLNAQVIPDYWNSGWVATLVLWSCISGGLSAYVLSSGNP